MSQSVVISKHEHGVTAEQAVSGLLVGGVKDRRMFGHAAKRLMHSFDFFWRGCECKCCGPLCHPFNDSGNENEFSWCWHR